MYKRDKRSPIPRSAAVSKLMSSIKGKNTKPEIALRKYLWKSGLRGYRLNSSELPGKPDIVFKRKKLVIFVNGCYWHGCKICGWTEPKHNTEYWVNKIIKNKNRDIVKQKQLEELGYLVLVIWEHEIKKDIQGAVNKIMDLYDRR
jgi:DNA mismatch endonuclease (patch repair protein)